MKSFEVIMKLTPEAFADENNQVVFHAEKVAELVRCGDCKYFAHDEMAVIHDTGYYCTRPNQQSCNLAPEDYCSYAKRKDEVEE